MKLLSTLPRWFTIPFAAFIVTRVLVFGALYIPKASGIVLYESPTFNFAPMSEIPPLLNPWARWDSAWYIRIADQGYTYNHNSILPEDNDVAFFPFYPVLIHFFNFVINNTLLTGIILSNICFLCALIVLYRFTEQYFNSYIATRTVIYLTIFPTSFFFSTAYTESLFLLLSLISAWACYQKQWIKASIFAAFASATRAQGILLIFLIILEWAQSHGWYLSQIRQKQAWENLYKALKSHPKAVFSFFLIPSGLILYMIYLQLAFHNPFAFNDALKAWGRQTVGPIAAIISAITVTFSGKVELSILPYYRLLEIAAFFIGLGLSILVYRRMGLGYTLYCLTSIWVSASGLIQGQLRYLIVLFPLFIVLAASAKPRFNKFYLCISFILLPLFTFCFTNWIFIG